MKQFFLFLCLWAGISASVAQVPLFHGHSHNDYTHEHPLTDALDYGFKSIEIDVFLHHDKLVVSHTATDLDHKKDIEELYLKPILGRTRANMGHVYLGDTTPTIFMVEFKNDPEASYIKLKELIVKYKGLFCDRSGHGRPIKLLITGNRPWETVKKGKEEYVTLDADINQSAMDLPPYIIERVSDPYGSHFTWRGRGTMPKAQRARLDSLVKLAHEHGRQIRFYACPENENIWRTLLDAKVDWINVDDLRRFATFYKQYAGTGK